MTDEKQAIANRIAEIQELLKQKKAQYYENLTLQEQYRFDNKIEFVPRQPNPKQALILDAWLNPFYKVFYYTGGERSAKTTTGTWLAISVMAGYFLWTDPPVKIPFIHKYPRKVRLVGQDWEKHIKTVLVPSLEEWWPKNRPVKTSKNTMGVDAFWKDEKTKSTLEIMSNGQDASLFLGWQGDLVIYDEPSDRDIRIACARGLVDRHGRELFDMTLLRQPWVNKEVVHAQNPDGTPDMSVFGVIADTLDNCSRCGECDGYIDHFEDRPTGPVGICPRCGEVTNYRRYGLDMEGIRDYAKKMTPKEQEAHLRGKPSYLSTLIWDIDRRLHVKKRFPVPLNWIVDVFIDFHPSKPWMVNFFATEPRQFHWAIYEMWENMNSKSMAEKIVLFLLTNKFRIGGIWIDPLAKGDENSGYTDETVFQIMWNVFAPYGINLQVASKDKDNGLKLVSELLMTENEMPALFFFDDLKKTLEQCENYVLDPKTGKPSKEEDDAPENLYRYALLNRQWEEPYQDQGDYRYVDDRSRSSATGY